VSDGARFTDRQEAGRALAAALVAHAHAPKTLVLALPRGGVPVGVEVASALGLPLDVLCVRKLGVPWQEELAMGAVAPGGVTYLDHTLIATLAIPEANVAAVIARESAELTRREAAYRAGRPPLSCRGQRVLLVDDGLATGATMRAAVRAARQLGAVQVTVAVPVGPPACCEALRDEADACLCLRRPEGFVAVAQGYRDFPQVTDDEVVAAVAEASIASAATTPEVLPSLPSAR
jgi:predicted phosphoribosyltransferase